MIKSFVLVDLICYWSYGVVGPVTFCVSVEACNGIPISVFLI